MAVLTREAASARGDELALADDDDTVGIAVDDFTRVEGDPAEFDGHVLLSRSGLGALAGVGAERFDADLEGAQDRGIADGAVDDHPGPSVGDASAGDDVAGEALAWAAPLLDQGPVLIAASAEPAAVKAAQDQIGRARAGELIETCMARVAEGLGAGGVRRLVVAGGETSGAAAGALPEPAPSAPASPRAAAP